MKIFQTVAMNPETGALEKCDSVEFEGKLWLIANWYDIPARGVRQPARLIRFDTLPHQTMTNPAYGADYVLNYPIPKELFAFETPKQAVPGFEYVEMPEITFPLPDKTKN
jgi:hypothetical protein